MGALFEFSSSDSVVFPDSAAVRASAFCRRPTSLSPAAAMFFRNDRSLLIRFPDVHMNPPYGVRPSDAHHRPSEHRTSLSCNPTAATMNIATRRRSSDGPRRRWRDVDESLASHRRLTVTSRRLRAASFRYDDAAAAAAGARSFSSLQPNSVASPMLAQLAGIYLFTDP
jgi:hypothetical protein